MAAPDPLREQSFERPLPNSSEAERAILGAILLDNALISQAIELLKPEDFYVPSHRRVFVAMIALFERGAEINPILIGEELKKESSLEVGGISSVTNLTYGLPHSSNIVDYAKVVRGKSLLRRLIRTASKITTEALEEEDEASVILDHAEHAIFELADERIRQGFTHVEPIAVQLLDKIQEMEGRKVVLTGLTTGFPELDEKTSGLQKSDLIIRPRGPPWGRPRLLMLAQTRLSTGAVVGIFFSRCQREALVMRMLCSQGNIDAQRFRNGFLPGEWAQIAKSLGMLAGTKIFLAILRVFQCWK
jgi:replicative DNA helicase